LLGALLLFGLRWFARGLPFPVLSISPLLLVFLLMVALGLLITPAPATAWMVACHTIAGLVVLVAIVDRASTQPHVIVAMGGLVLGATVFAAGAPFAAAWSGADGFTLGNLNPRTFPLLARPSNVNNIAGALEAAVPLALGLLAAHRRPWNIVGALALAPIVLMLVLLQSRGSWLAVLMGLVVYATLYRRWILPLVPLVLLGGLWLNNTFGEPVPAAAIDGAEQSVITMGDRTGIWSEGLRLLSAAPLTGIGINGFSVLGAPQLGRGSGEYVLRNSHAHNLFLELALDLGVIGLISFVGILGITLVAAWRVYRSAPVGSIARALVIGLLGAFTVIITHGLFDTIFWGFKAGIFLWGLIGLALALERTMAESEADYNTFQKGKWPSLAGGYKHE
jgi:putative inorganic carbon (HCO3(-)) transporter